MKIAIISKYFPPNIRGGGEISALNLARGLSREGIEVHVITSKEVSEIPGSEFALYPLFETIHAPKIFDPLIRNDIFYRESFKALDRLLSWNKDFDLLNAWNMYSIPGTVKAALKHKIPSVITINSHWMTCPTGEMLKRDKMICEGDCGFLKSFYCYSQMRFPENMIAPIYSRLLRSMRIKATEQANAVVSISKSLDNYIKHSIKPEISYVIPNIVEVEKFQQKSHEEFASDILFLGNLEKPKGCEYLITAMGEVVRNHPDVRLRIIGRGREELSLKKLSSSLGLGKNILFEGFVDYEKIPAYYASTSIVVFPSIWPEPFGRISVEAMAAGKPVAAAAVGGIPEVVEHGRTGLLVQPWNPSQIAEAILYLLDNEDIAKRMGKNGIEEAKKYSSEVISKKYIEVYTQVIETYGVK
jgi:glycosyltransferase involved in cell wall biosynthesis